jgi:hypothetical protein
MANYGTVENPVRLDLYQRIVEVGWGGGWMVLTLDTPDPGLPSFNHGFFPIFPSGEWDPNVELLSAEQDPPGINKFDWAFLIQPAPFDTGEVLYHDEEPQRDKLMIWSFVDTAAEADFIADCVERTGNQEQCEEAAESLQVQHDDFRTEFQAAGYTIEDVGSSYIIIDANSAVQSFPNPELANKDYPPPPREIWADDRRMGPNPGRRRTYALKYITVDPAISERKKVRYCWLLNTVGGPPAFEDIMEISQSAGHDEKLGSYMNKYTLEKYSRDVVFRVESGKFVEVPPAEGQPSKLKGTATREVPYDQLGLVLRVSKGGFVT